MLGGTSDGMDTVLMGGMVTRRAPGAISMTLLCAVRLRPLVNLRCVLRQGHTTAIMASAEKRYAAAQVRDILRRAQQKDAAKVSQDADGLSAKELIENAKDLGFSTRDVQTALVEYEDEQRVTVAAQEIRQLQYRRLSTHAIFFAALLGALTVFGAWASLGTPLLVVMMLWATMFLLQLRGALFPNPDQLRAAAKQRLLSQQLKHSGKQLGTALATGAAKLMEFSAQKIDQGVKQLDK